MGNALCATRRPSSINVDEVREFLQQSRPEGCHINVETVHAVLQRACSAPDGARCAIVMLPGSFNPVHTEHIATLDIAIGDESITMGIRCSPDSSFD